jgi:hypothetical protein
MANAMPNPKTLEWSVAVRIARTIAFLKVRNERKWCRSQVGASIRGRHDC